MIWCICHSATSLAFLKQRKFPLQTACKTIFCEEITQGIGDERIEDCVSPSISHSNPSKKVAHNWHLDSTTTISASNALYGTWDQIVSSEEKGRWSNGDWNFCDIEILERANSSPHLAGSDPIDQGTIVTSPLSPLSPHVSHPKSSDLCCYWPTQPQNPSSLDIVPSS